MPYPTGLLPASPPLPPLTMVTTINAWLDALKRSWIGTVEPPNVVDGMQWVDTSSSTGTRFKIRIDGAWVVVQQSVGLLVSDCDDAIEAGMFRYGTSALNSPSFGSAGTIMTAPRVGALSQLGFIQSSGESRLISVRSALNDDYTAWTLWRKVYTQADIIGTCSLDLSIPSGAIIESGLNANGTYIRWADGTQMCWHKQDMDFDAISRLSGTWVFPKPFVDSAARAGVVLSQESIDITPTTSALGQIAIDSLTPTKVDVYLYRIIGQTNFGSGDEATIHMTMMGRWY